MRQRKAPDQQAVEARRALVGPLVLRRYSVRRIVGALAALPEGERPSDLSPATIGRDILALRAEWRERRLEAMDAVIERELAKLDDLEAPLLQRARDNGEAFDRWMALQGRRLQVLGVGRGGVTLPGGVQLPGAPVGGALRVTVEYVDDWRVARNAVAGDLVPVLEGSGGEAADGAG